MPRNFMELVKYCIQLDEKVNRSKNLNSIIDLFWLF